MSNPFVAEIKIFAGNFAPVGYAFCAGQILPISQNTALFSLLGTMYGGDGKSNFALPDLRDRVAIGFGQGSGLSNYSIGETGGVETVTLAASEVPAHTHPLNCVQAAGGDVQSPAGALPAREAAQVTAAWRGGAPDGQMNPQSIGPAGGGQPHENKQPYLALNFIIALQGVFPARS